MSLNSPSPHGEDLYHAAPTTERDRIMQHGLQPSNPLHTWGHPPEKWLYVHRKLPAEGIYTFRDLDRAQAYSDALTGARNVPHDVWRIPANQIQAEPLRDIDQRAGLVVPHPVLNPELVSPVEKRDQSWMTPEEYSHYEFGDTPESIWRMQDENDPGFQTFWENMNSLPSEMGIGKPNRVWGKTADAPVEPPNYRRGNDKSYCGNCKMFDKGKCWGYGNYAVKSDDVCDSWAAGTKQSNILDPVQNELSPFVWQFPDAPEPLLHRTHHKYIVELITSVLNQEGYNDTHLWLSLVLTGSLTTYQYSDASDCDVSLFVQTETGAINQALRAELIAIMVGHVDNQILPGTPYLLQAYVVPPNVGKDQLYKPGLRAGYDINEDRWLVPPDKSLAHDVDKEMNNAYVYALRLADKMDMLLRYEPQQAQWLAHRLHKKRQYAQRAGLGDFSIENLAWKALANRGLLSEINALTGERY